MELMLGRSEPDLGYEEPLVATDVDRIAEASYATHKAKLLYDALGVCYHGCTSVRGVLRILTDALDGAVGLRLTPEEALMAGERIAVLQRLISVSRGYTPEDDFDMGERLFEKIPSGPAAGHGLDRDDWRRLRDEFYELQGWSLETGAPLPEVLARTGLENFVLGRA
jgi:aldehyde:ferredoxin oxidoreductase